MSSSRRDALVVTVAAVAILGLSVFGVMLRNASVGDAPGEDSVDVGFARDTQVHHAQAVEMAELLLDRSSDDSVKALARDILLGQQAQIGEMRGWLEAWDRPVTSTDPPMAWASEHSGHTEGEMPGLASDAEIAQLTAASGTEADVLFLELMIRHHEGGLHMAQLAEDSASESIVRKVAGTIASAQSAEIDNMEQLLEPLRAP